MKYDRYHRCSEQDLGGADECGKDGTTYFYAGSPMDGDLNAHLAGSCSCPCHQPNKKNS